MTNSKSTKKEWLFETFQALYTTNDIRSYGILRSGEKMRKQKNNLINRNGWKLFLKTWCCSPTSVIRFWRVFMYLAKIKLKSGQTNLHLVKHVSFEVISRLNWRHCSQSDQESGNLCFISYSCLVLLHSNILMEEILVGRKTSALWQSRGKTCQNKFPRKKEFHKKLIPMQNMLYFSL